jgi:teichuronic acid biosynthesis glycosyltransferase TuaC
MKILFVSSGRKGEVGEVVKNQGDSLVRAGIEVEYFIIRPGFFGYLTAIFKIRKLFRDGNYDLVHAHYSLSALAASLAGSFPLVASLMGSDTYISGFLRFSTRLFSRYRWYATIVKTEKMKNLTGIKNARVIPNGVNLDRFKPILQAEAKRQIGYSRDKKLIIFVSDPNRPEKNFDLATKAIKKLNNSDAELMPVYNVPNTDVPLYMNAADALLLTSNWEGSVNVIKEAMACNCPIVSTDVGDVGWVIGKTEGCYLCSSDSGDIAEKIKSVLVFGKRTLGRERIIYLGLDSESVATEIKKLYNNLLGHSSFKPIRHIIDLK